MKAEIITIGDEILIGQVVDTNSNWIASYLKNFGIQVKKITSVSDTKQDILQSLTQAENNSDLIIVTGGLGPTKDDITKIAACEYFKSSLVFNQDVYNDLIEFFRIRGKKISETNLLQAEMPHNCIPLRNHQGTAPGMWFEKNNKIFVFLPGVPYEMKTLIENEVIPKLKNMYSLPAFYAKTIQLIGIAESDLSDILEPFEKQLPDELKLAYLPSPGYIRLRLSLLTGIPKQELFNVQYNFLKSIISEYIFTEDSYSLPEIIGTILKSNNLTLSTAESCTGGNIAHEVTLVPGSSDYFYGSVIAYSNTIKENVLGVKKDTIKKFGAVSKQVVTEMAKNVLSLFNTDFSVAVSGIAGPTGGTKNKPVGTTWIAVADKNDVIAKKYYFGENRERNIEKASLYALNMLRIKLLGL